jgi:HSP20 family protein
MEEKIMTLVRKNQGWLPLMFNDLFDNNCIEKSAAAAPAINVKENKTGFEIEVAAPGMAKEDFVIRIDEDNDLVIAMEKKSETVEENESRYLRREFGYSKFEQTMVLPENADKEAVSAKMENGVLQITIPKLSEQELKKSQRLIEIA